MTVPQRKHRVLVVDDTPNNRELLRSMFLNAGYEVLTASDGSEGFEVARRERPDLVISDVSMPGVNGVTFCRLIRADANLCTTPVLLVSALYKDTATVVEGLQAGADDYIEAPYDPLRLVAKAARLIEMGSAANALRERERRFRRRVEETLRTSEKSYRDLVENARDIIYSHDLTGRFTWLNRAGEQLTGYTRQEIITLNIDDVVAPEYLELAKKMMARKIAGETTTIYELEIVTKDSRRLVLEINSRPIYRDGKAVGMQGVARDVTERRQLEEQLRQSQKMECVGRLAAGVAHDFNNLLTVITGYSELLLERFAEDEYLADKLEEIRKASKRASALTYQLLAFSRKQVLQPKVLDINAIVTEVGKMLQRLIGEDIELVMVLHPGIGRIEADPGQISQIIINLAVNARDAMPQGGKLSIETANVHLDQEYVRHHLGAEPGSYVMLALVDTGIGMDADTQQQVFEPFFTTKGSEGGTGLGLATVYGIVKQSGGYITVESEVGLGSTFRIYLPLVDLNDEESAWLKTANGKMPKGTEKILLVEDELAVRTLAREILEMCGYDVLEARNGAEAVSICETVDCVIDLLVTDVVMPQMSGRELAEHLSETRPKMRVLYMSGYTDDAIVRHGLGDGSANFIQKPFTPENLARKVRGVLDEPAEVLTGCRNTG